MSAPFSGMVLCAGLGNRLRPLTDVLPKPLIPLLDTPLAEQAFAALTAAGVEAIAVNTHHLPEQMAEAARGWATRYGNVPLSLSHEQTLLGTGAGAKRLYEALGRPDHPILLHNGDVVLSAPVSELLRHHRASGAAATLLTVPAIPGEGEVWVDAAGGRITTLPGRNGVVVGPDALADHRVSYAGVCILEPWVIDLLPDEPSCLIREGIAIALERGAAIAALHHEGFWADVGTPLRFLQATWQLLKLGRDNWPLPAKAPDGDFVAAETTLECQGVAVAGPAFISTAAILDSTASVGPYAVVGAGCAVPAGSHVAESVLAYGAVAEQEQTRRILIGSTLVRTG
jgi:mannose-1-phosphate guanylyltransferase